ncbi:GNAT family N-acetyltransferase [Streptomyces sp. NPDC049954]|uniref:GNAT family N-acetyltransferase n=1 Tax=Streptomyces sp. NPDC049954 TaxID=3155779 RepID=UPI0034181546
MTGGRRGAVSRARADWFRRSRATVTDLLAVDEDGAPLCWVSMGPYRDEHSATVSGVSEVYALYAEPDRIGTGVGRLLIEAVHTRVEHRTRLWVLAGNTRARRFYERAGYRADGAERLDDYGGPVLTELRYERTAG